jgi:hypothetical protein
MRRTSAPGSIDNKYVDRNLDIGREGTLILAENMNDFQEEIANAIEEAGITLDSGDQAQLSKAVVLTGGDKDQQVTGVKSFTEIIILPASNPTTGNQATRKTYVDTLDSANVKLTGNQSVGGTKTFTSPPVVPTPTAATHAARKEYVDDAVSALEGDAVLLTGNQSIGGTKTFTSTIVGNLTGNVSGNAGTVTNGVYTSRTLTAGDGLSGGGSLAANRSFAVDSTVVRTSGDQTIYGEKSFTGTINTHTLFVGTNSFGTTTFKDDSVVSFDGILVPRDDPTTGTQSISAASAHTPTRGLYNGSFVASGGRSAGPSGPFSGTLDTQVTNSSDNPITWYYARF